MANVKFEYNGKLSDGRFWDEDSKKRIVVDLEDSDLTVTEMLQEFMNFMKAIGYDFELGDRLVVVNDLKTESQPEKAQVVVEEQPIVDESGSVIGMAHGSSAPVTATKTSYDELKAEIERVRSNSMGLSEEEIAKVALRAVQQKISNLEGV